jgi:peroxiredoxin
MASWKRTFLLIGAVACFSAALFIILRTGLPERADFTGQLSASGLLIAPEVGAIAPTFALQKPDGDRISLGTMRGAPIIINFWATWCEPCRVEMPALQAIYDVHREAGLRILAVNLGETAETAQAWSQEMQLSFDILLDPQQEVVRLYQLRGQPSTYVVSPDGVITHIFYGPMSETALYSALAPYFPT